MFGLVVDVFSIVGIVCLAMLYESESILYIAIWLFFLFLFMCIFHVIRIGKIKIEIKTHSQFGEKGTVFPVDVLVSNTGWFAVHKSRIQIQANYRLSHYKKKEVLFCDIPGRGGKTQLQLQFLPDRMGMVELEIKEMICYDFFGLIGVPVRKKNRMQKEYITVLPERKSIEIQEMGGNGRNYGEYEVDATLFGEKNPPDISEIRPYRAGDKLRSIHWKLSAKEDEWMVYEFKTEQLPSTVLYLEPLCASKRKKLAGVREKKKRQRELLQYLSDIYSVSMELLEREKPHYMAYIEFGTGQVRRKVIARQEDVYEFVAMVSADEFDGVGTIEELQEQYQEQYQLQGKIAEYVLDRTGKIRCEQEMRR